jgi:D-alanyl-D-alanine carboxypeptidase
VSPNGLHDPEHYTTPYDLSVIAREAFKNDWVRETMAKKTSQVTVTTGAVSKLLNLENRNKLVGIDGCIGGKTGYTEPAGRVLVAFFDRDGRKLVGVVMKSLYGSQDTIVFDDMKKIIDWSYNAKPVALHNSGDTVKTETLTYKPFRFFGPEKTINVPLVLHDDVKYYDNDINKKENKEDYKVDKLDAWNLTTDKPSGNLVINERESSKNFKLYSTVSTKDIVKENVGLYIASALGILLLLAVILGLTIKIKNNRRRSSRRYY